MPDRATQYAYDVRDGKIVAGKPVRLACLRHLADIDNQAITGLQWIGARSEEVIGFFHDVLTVEVANEVVPFDLLPFQCFIVGSLFGWLNPDGTRRFKTAYIEMGKGSGKTPLAAGIGHYGLVADGCLSPEIYCAATMTKQAEIAFRDAKAMAERSEELHEALEVSANLIRNPANNGIYRALSSEHKGLDGKRVHMAIVDEVHEHPTSMVCDKMKKGTKKDLNALIVEITNSGSDLESVCYHHHEYSLNVLRGIVQDDAWFAYVCALDEKTDEQPGDDWMNDESCWIKTNPGLGSILPIQYLRKEVNEAKGMPSQRNIAARLNFCVWTQAHELWIPIEKWDWNNRRFDPDEQTGEACWLGMDLSEKRDLSAVVACFKYPLEEYMDVNVAKLEGPSRDAQTVERSLNIDFGIKLMAMFFIPEDTMYEREKEDGVQYSRWQKEGWLIATPGPTVDKTYIYDWIVEFSDSHAIQEIGYDQAGATDLAGHLQNNAGLKVVEVPQGFRGMSEASQLFEALVYGGRVQHNGNPLMRWNVQNAGLERSRNMRMIYPKKNNQRKRIDGVTAAVMALSRAMVGETTESIYDNPESAWLHV